MADTTRKIGLSLGADICWPICYEQLMQQLDLAIPIDGNTVRFEVERVSIEPFDLRAPAAFDVIVLVDAAPATRKARLVEDRGLEPPEADRLLAAQDPTETKRERSDYVIDNDGTEAQLELATRAVWQALAARAV